MQVIVIVNLFFWSTENYIIIIRYIGTVKYYKGLGGPLRTYYAFWITPRAILRREIASVISGWTTWILKKLTQIFHEFTQGCIAMQPKFWEVFSVAMALSGFFGVFLVALLYILLGMALWRCPKMQLKLGFRVQYHLWHASLRVPHDFIPGRKARYGCLLALCGVVGVSA